MLRLPAFDPLLEAKAGLLLEMIFMLAGTLLTTRGLSTVTVAVFDGLLIPREVNARAVITWDPFGVCVLSQLYEYGSVVSGAPRFWPSSLN